MKPGSTMRVARPTDNLAAIAEMYAKGLGFAVLAEFKDHRGVDGVILGHARQRHQIDNLVLDYAARLEKFCDHINRCDVAIEQTNHTHQKGNPYRCRIDVTVARGHELVADERRTDNGSHQPLNKIIHDAFKTMERELCRVVDKQRRYVKTHADSRSPK